ncbi:MAG: LCP family protein [Clostridia bacterium]|nr:LCP family protein [Clostridia bacterium]
MDRPRSKRRRSKRRRTRRMFITLFCVIIILSGLFSGGLIYVKSLLGQAERVDLNTDDLGIVTTPPTTVSENDDVQQEEVPAGPEVINFALYGVDTRSTTDTTGNSDVIMIVSVDKTNNKIRLISIARDTYVAVEGYGSTKINHAFSYGGPTLAIKTLNQNFQMDIQDFVAVNFAQVAEIIDYVGGVTVNVDSDERRVANQYIAELNRIGIPCSEITQTGDVLLSGPQAVAYSRDRYNGNDGARTGRQREVLMALYETAKKQPVTRYPGLVKLVLAQCSTSLTDSEMLELGIWAVTNNATIEQYSFPDGNVNSRGETINGMWCYVYDLDKATEILHRFIYEDTLPE